MIGKILILFLVIGGIMLSCVRSNESSMSAGIRTSQLEIQHIIRLDSTVVGSLQGVPSNRTELDSFLVDYAVVRRTDSLLSRECDWYCLRTLVDYDSAVNCSIYVDIPNTSSFRLNAMMKRSLSKYKDDFLSKLRQLNEDVNPFIIKGMYSDYRAQLISAFEDSTHISFCFSIEDYLAGTPHGKHFYQSFNYDKRSKSLITFNDLFSIQSPEDSTLMCDLIKATIGEEGLDPFGIYEYDFNLNSEFIVFNFDDYEIAPYVYGSPRVPLNRQALFSRFGKNQ